MAASRFTGSKVNWKAIVDRFPMKNEEQASKLLKLKKNHETYLRRLVSLPEKSPPIDWAAYKAKIPNAAFVDAIKQKYEAVQIPYPKSNVDDIINSKEKENADEVAKIKKEALAEIEAIQKKLAVLDELLPVKDMTIQEFKQAYPDAGVNVEYPSPWPHDDDETNSAWRKYIAAKEKGIPAERPRG